MKKHISIGVAAGVLLLLVYAGTITLAQGLEHVLEETARLWYWVLPLAGGFGVHAGLFSFLRQSLLKRRASTAGVAGSGGISAVSMVACCAHHLSDVLPLLGLSGLATLLVNYQLFFITVGLLSNAVGITIMLETIQHQGLCPWLARLQLDMSWVKRATALSALLIGLLALSLYL